jgi:Na+/phosphate symporter
MSRSPLVVLMVLVVFSVVFVSACRRADSSRPSDESSNRRVVQSSRLDAEVEQLEGLEASVRAVAEKHGGFVASALSSGSGDDGTLLVTLRVAAPQLNVALKELEALTTRVDSRQLTADDVTSDWVDLEGQQRNLSAAKDRLVELLARASTATEALEVNRALTEVQGQLEQVQGRFKAVQQNVALATITATFSPRAHVSFGAWRPLEVAGSALVALGVLAKGAANVAIVLLVFSPVWGGALLLWRRRPRSVTGTAPAPR